MTNITVQTINSTLVIDSRLIAAELGIEHRALKKTIQTYQSDFEEFGTLDTASVGVVGTSSYAESNPYNPDLKN
jgi:phage regulator Rha-like protein